MNQTHRIVRLQASNVKKLKAIDIVPHSDTVKLKGKNAAGKSSVLDAIYWCLAGKKALPDRPIRDGESKAESVLDLGDFTVKLRITAATGAKLTITSKDGLDVRSPQTLLSSYSNEILLDPVSFLRLGETPEGKRRQAETLRRLVGLDFSDLDSKKASAYAERTEANRELEKARHRLTLFPQNIGVPDSEVSVTELMAQLNKATADGNKVLGEFDKKRENELTVARANNTSIERAKSNWNIVHTRLNDKKEEVASVTKLIAELQEKLKLRVAEASQLEQEAMRLKSALDQLRPTDMETLTAIHQEARDQLQAKVEDTLLPIQEQISKADETNTKVRANRQHDEIAAEVKRLHERAETLTQTISQCEKAKEDALAGAKFPLPGLSFDESGILLNRLPLNQGSQAEQLKAVLAIGFALKPRIRVALVRDASLLDADSLQQISQICSEQDAQVWLECVTSDDPTAIEIVDGSVKE